MVSLRYSDFCTNLVQAVVSSFVAWVYTVAVPASGVLPAAPGTAGYSLPYKADKPPALVHYSRFTSLHP